MEVASVSGLENSVIQWIRLGHSTDCEAELIHNPEMVVIRSC